MKTYTVTVSDEMGEHLEQMARRDLRPVDGLIQVVLHRHLYGLVDAMTDAEWAAYEAEKAKQPPRTPRINITAKVRNRIFERCEGKCAYCHGVLLYDQPFHIDHIVPLAKGGTNDESNLTLACPLCNSRKSANLVAVKSA